MKIIISGGGTGGHVFPAIAIADAIKSLEPNADILFVGAQGKLEMEKVPKAGYSIQGLNIRGFQRKLTVRNLVVPFLLVGSLAKAWRLINEFKPDAVVGVGGYASGPVMEVATRLKLPSLIQEQNSYAGMTNRLVAKRVQRICVAYENMERYFPAEKIVWTGNPVRDAIRNSKATREEALNHFGLKPDKKTVLVFGGSLGAHSMNVAMSEQEELIRSNPEVQVIWQVGSLYWNRYKSHPVAELKQVHALPFIERMELAYALADVIVGRAGALSISELCLVGKPVVLIPSPNVAEDHQTKNAQALVNKDAAVLVRDADASEKILKEPFSLLANPNRMAEMGKNILTLARPDAAEHIAREVLKLAGRQEA